MEHAVQAHVGEVVCLESCTLIETSAICLKPSTEIIVSGGTDDNLAFWKIVVSIKRRGRTVLSLIPLLKVMSITMVTKNRFN